MSLSDLKENVQNRTENSGSSSDGSSDPYAENLETWHEYRDTLDLKRFVSYVCKAQDVQKGDGVAAGNPWAILWDELSASLYPEVGDSDESLKGTLADEEGSLSGFREAYPEPDGEVVETITHENAAEYGIGEYVEEGDDPIQITEEMDSLIPEGTPADYKTAGIPESAKDARASSDEMISAAKDVKGIASKAEGIPSAFNQNGLSTVPTETLEALIEAANSDD